MLPPADIASVRNYRCLVALALTALSLTPVSAQTPTTPPNFTFDSFAGSNATPGLVDGTGSAARFEAPNAMTIDASGNLFVQDDNTVRKITPAGVVTTVAGSPSRKGGDGPVATAGFNFPTSLVAGPDGTIYLAEGNGLIRKISTDGIVSTIAGQPSVYTQIESDGTGTAAIFASPRGIATDANNNVYVVDYNGGTLRKITPDGVVTTLAGTAFITHGIGADGVGPLATLYLPWGLASDAAGNLYETEPYARIVRKITPDTTVTTIAGSANNTYGTADGTGSAARFYFPSGIASDPNGNLYVVDTQAGTIRKITPAQEVTTLAGTPLVFGSADGVGPAAQFSGPAGIAVDRDGNVYVSDEGNTRIRKISSDATVTTLAGPAGQTGAADGIGAAAQFFSPGDVVADSSGNIYVADTGNSTIRKVTPDAVVTTLAGTARKTGSTDGTGPAARFNHPSGLTVDNQGNVYVADAGNLVVRKITADGTVTTLAGTAGQSGSVDGTGPAARFTSLSGIAVDSTGNVYLSDGSTLRKVSPTGIVTTLAGSAQLSGTADGTGSAARFNRPSGITIDQSGTIYVAEMVAIRKVTPDGVVTTYARASNTGANLYNNTKIAVDGRGYVYVTDEDPIYWSGRIQQISPQGTVAMFLTSVPVDDGYGTAVEMPFADPVGGICFDRNGNFYIADTASSAIRKGTFVPDTPAITWSTPASIAYGTALSATQLNATTETDGTFTYSPASGAVLGVGTHSLDVSFEPTDKVNYTNATAEVGLTVTPCLYAGKYFGTFASGGAWALEVYADQPALFISYLPDRQSAVVEHLYVDQTGAFSVAGTELVPPAAGTFRRPSTLGHTGARATATAASFTLSGQIDQGGTVTGQMAGLSETLTGATASTSGAFTASLYTAPQLNASSGATYVFVDASGQAIVVTDSPTAVDGASGTLDGSGRLTATTSNGSTLSLTVNAAKQLASITLTPAGSSTPIKFSGLAEGVASNSHLVNISARGAAGTGNDVTIGGFVVSGHTPKRYLIRAVGPTLTTQGISQTEVMADPTIELHDALHQNAVIATNDNWGDDADAADIVTVGGQIGATAFAPGDTTSSALLQTLNPGVYSFIAQGKASTTGVVLIEVYDADTADTGAKLINISTRAKATTGNGVAIGGFVVGGDAPKRLLVRAVGPTLTTQGLTTAEILQDPTIEVHDALHGNAVVATNDNWGDNANAADIATTGARIGATPLAQTDTTSSALLLTVAPGVYSFIANGKSGATGIVLVEVYDAD